MARVVKRLITHTAVEGSVAHHRHHLAGLDGEGQVVDDGEVLLLGAPAVLREGER